MCKYDQSTRGKVLPTIIHQTDVISLGDNQSKWLKWWSDAVPSTDEDAEQIALFAGSAKWCNYSG